MSERTSAERRAPAAPGGTERSREVPALLAGYWSFGQYWGVWVILVFEFQRAHGVTNLWIGLDYTTLSIVAVLTMLLLAPRMQPLSLSVSVPIALASLALGTFAIAFLPSSAILLAFAAVGVGNGLIDVYLNVAAQRAETRTGRPVLQWMHATYALGGITGAAAAGLIRAANVDYRIGLSYSGVMLLSTAVWAAVAVPHERTPEGLRTRLSITAFFRSPALLVPAVIVLSSFLIEGSMDAWAGLYLRDQLGATAEKAAVAFIMFASAVFLGRLFAGRVLFGLGRRTTILVAGFGSAAGGLMVVLANDVAVAGLAFLVLGFTLSAAVPAAFGLAGDATDDPANAIAAVTTVGYTAFVWSPPILGWVAQTADLRAAMGVIVAATLGVIAGGLLTPRDPERST